MTAKEMFESLGYEQQICSDEIRYVYCKRNFCIGFNLEYKEFYGESDNEAIGIEVDEFKAIQQQMKELGWLE